MIFRKLSLAMAVVASVCTLQSAHAQTDSIFEIANAPDSGFNALADALVAAGLAEALNCKENCDPKLTALAPTDQAFLDIDFPILGIPQLRDILGYHVVAGELLEEDITDGQKNTTLIGEVVTFTLDPDLVNEAGITFAEVPATNGIIDVLDEVLKPSSVTSNLVDKLVAATEADPAEFTILVTLVLAAGLAEDLATLSPLTVFAPTDQAFANLFEAFPGVDEYLLDPMNKGVLQDILKLHVSPANADSVILKESAEPFGGMIKIPTLTEEFIKVTVSDDGIMINDSNVVSPLDIIANNGVAHTLDAVLLPDGFVFPPPEPSSKSAKRGTYSPSAKSGKGGKRHQSMMGLDRLRLREHRAGTDEDEETLEESEQSMLF